MKLYKTAYLTLTAAATLASIGVAWANDIHVVHVRQTDEVRGSHALVGFDLGWDNSWRSDLSGVGHGAPFNYDAAWVFVKFSTDGGATWHHASLSGRSDAHTVLLDNGVAATIQPTADCNGVFIYRADNGSGTNHWQDVRLRWNYAADGVACMTPATIVKVFAIEMVYIPCEGFLLGDNSSAPIRGQFEDGTSGNPFAVTSEDAIDLGGGAGGLGNNNADGMAHVDDFNDTSQRNLPAVFPKGYRAFFAMKYEITQGQYADFLNTLTSDQAAARSIAQTENYTDFRGRIAGAYPYFEAEIEDRAGNFLNWMDGAAYADWASLRPMTELEYEKAARGKSPATPGEYAWGNTHIVQATTISGAEDGSETIGNSDANCAYDNALFTGGDGGYGPLRGGIFAAGVNPADTPSRQRERAGASFYGVMELSGNLWEYVVSVGNPQGRCFSGTHGDGELTDNSGNATNTDWPGIDAVASQGVTGANGSGFRGGSWADDALGQRISDRACANTIDTTRKNNYGFRGVRTAR